MASSLGRDSSFGLRQVSISAEDAADAPPETPSPAEEPEPKDDPNEPQDVKVSRPCVFRSFLSSLVFQLDLPLCRGAQPCRGAGAEGPRQATGRQGTNSLYSAPACENLNDTLTSCSTPR